MDIYYVTILRRRPSDRLQPDECINEELTLAQALDKVSGLVEWDYADASMALSLEKRGGQVATITADTEDTDYWCMSIDRRPEDPETWLAFRATAFEETNLDPGLV